MFIKIVRAISLLGLGLLFVMAPQAAEEDSKLVGYWQPKGEAIVLEIKQTEGRLEGVMVRNDWAPGLVDILFVKNVQYNSDSGRWRAEVYDTKSNEFRDAIIVSKSDDLITIKVKKRRRVTYLKTESIATLR